MDKIWREFSVYQRVKYINIVAGASVTFKNILPTGNENNFLVCLSRAFRIIITAISLKHTETTYNSTVSVIV